MLNARKLSMFLEIALCRCHILLASKFSLVPAWCLNVLLCLQSWCRWQLRLPGKFRISNRHFKSILVNFSPLPSIFCYGNTVFSLALRNIFDRHTSCPCALPCAAHLRDQLCAGGLMAGLGEGRSWSPPCSEDRSMKASRDGSSSSDCPRSSVKMNQYMVSGLLNLKVPIKLPTVCLRCQ